MLRDLLKEVDSSPFEKNWIVTCHVFVGSGSSSNSIDDPSTTDGDLMLRSFPGEEISLNRFLWSTPQELLYFLTVSSHSSVGLWHLLLAGSQGGLPADPASRPRVALLPGHNQSQGNQHSLTRSNTYPVQQPAGDSHLRLEIVSATEARLDSDAWAAVHLDGLTTAGTHPSQREAATGPSSDASAAAAVRVQQVQQVSAVHTANTER